MIRLYLDEDMSDAALVRALRLLAVDVLSTVEASQRRKPDVEQLLFATGEERVIYSRNARDFHRLHTEYLHAGRSHAGIILLQRPGPSIGEQARALACIDAAFTTATMRDRLEYLGAWLERRPQRR